MNMDNTLNNDSKTEQDALKYQWYIVNVYSGYENKVAEAVNAESKKHMLTDYFRQVLVPKQPMVEVKNGKKIVKEKTFFPGYILVNMHMTDDSWHLVKDIPRVTGFLGARGKPQPISDREANVILKQIEESMVSPTHTILYSRGDSVKVIDGPFSSFMGLVEEVENDKHRLKVAVTIFGRATPVDLDFSQVEKV